MDKVISLYLISIYPNIHVSLISYLITWLCPQVPPASVPMAKYCKVDDPHLLGLDPGLLGHSGAVLPCHQSGGQEVDGDEAGGDRNWFVAFQVKMMYSADLGTVYYLWLREWCKKSVEISTTW